MGGNAFDDAVPIPDGATARRVFEALADALPWTMEAAGSFGLRETLPDLDVVVLQEDFDRDALDGLGVTKTYNLGGAGLRFPFEGRFHQVDFFPAVSLEWGRFARAGAADSGALRILLLKAAAATFEQEGADLHVWGPDDRILLRAGRTLDQRVGLRRIYQHRFRANGRGLLKSAKTVDVDEFARRFGRRMPEVPILSVPDAVLALILDEPPTGVDESAASLAAYMRETFDPARLARVRVKLEERGFEPPAALSA